MHPEFGFEEDRAIFTRQLDKNCYLNPRNVSLYVIVFLKNSTDTLFRIRSKNHRIEFFDMEYISYILWWQEISFKNNIREMNIFIQME